MLHGHVIYFPFLNYKEYEFDISELNGPNYQELQEIKIYEKSIDGIIKMQCDFIGTDENWGGYFKGFLYPNNEFSGNFHYTADAKINIKEVFNGLYNEINGGYEIKGWAHADGSEKYGFYFKIWNLDLANSENKNTPKIKTINKSKKLKKTNENCKIDTFQNVLNIDLLENLIKKALPQKERKLKGKYNLYDHIIKMKPQPNSINNLILAISVAYSWMPTMVDVYVNDKKELHTALRIIKDLGNIKSLSDFENNQLKIEKGLIKLSCIINNSIVGTSKVLHIFYPNSIPIFDSKVLLGWDKSLKKQFKEYPELKLPINIPNSLNRRVSIYMKYWRLLLMFKQNTKQKSIRIIEEPLYMIGS
jgi:hypothetical protein